MNDFQIGVSLLQSDPNASFNFEGTSGPLDFEPSGEAPAAIEAWFFDVDTSTVKSYGEILTPELVYIEGRVLPLIAPDSEN